MFVLIGIAAGLLASVPVGPVNVFVISQPLKRDFLHGLLAGLTAVTLDVACCFIALAGLFKIKVALPPHAFTYIKAAAAVIILLLARKLLRDARNFEIPQDRDKIPSASPKPILGVFLLYLTNPTLYMFWIAVAGTATSVLHSRLEGWRAVAFAASVGIGSLTWYLSLVRFVSRHQHRLKNETFRRILFSLGLLLAAFGIVILGMALSELL
jgi:threonine/homoserine/homoserine lactone efflux protein